MGEPIDSWNKAMHFENAASILEEGDERSFVRDTLQGLIDTIAALRVENERLKLDAVFQDANVRVSNERAIQAEATTAAVVGALEQYACPEKCGVPRLKDGSCLYAMQGDCGLWAREAIATLPARVVAMAKMPEVLEEIAASEEMYDAVEPKDRARRALTAYHASTEPVSQSEADKGMEKRT